MAELDLEPKKMVNALSCINNANDLLLSAKQQKEGLLSSSLDKKELNNNNSGEKIKLLLNDCKNINEKNYLESWIEETCQLENNIKNTIVKAYKLGGEFKNGLDEAFKKKIEEDPELLSCYLSITKADVSEYIKNQLEKANSDLEVTICDDGTLNIVYEGQPCTLVIPNDFDPSKNYAMITDIAGAGGVSTDSGLQYLVSNGFIEENSDAFLIIPKDLYGNVNS